MSWNPERESLSFTPKRKKKCWEEDYLPSSPTQSCHSAPIPIPISYSNPYASHNALTLLLPYWLSRKCPQFLRALGGTAFWVWTIWETRSRGSRRQGRAEELGQGKARLLGGVTRDREPEALGSSALKGVRPHFVVACPSVASIIHLVSLFRYPFASFFEK